MKHMHSTKGSGKIICVMIAAVLVVMSFVPSTVVFADDATIRDFGSATVYGPSTLFTYPQRGDSYSLAGKTVSLEDDGDVRYLVTYELGKDVFKDLFTQVSPFFASYEPEMMLYMLFARGGSEYAYILDNFEYEFIVDLDPALSPKKGTDDKYVFTFTSDFLKVDEENVHYDDDSSLLHVPCIATKKFAENMGSDAAVGSVLDAMKKMTLDATATFGTEANYNAVRDSAGKVVSGGFIRVYLPNAMFGTVMETAFRAVFGQNAIHTTPAGQRYLEIEAAADITTILAHTVTFVDGEDPETVYSTAIVNDGGTVGEPDDPEKEDLYFEGWYADPEMTEPFDFDAPITEDKIVYAKFTETPPEPETHTVTFVDGEDPDTVYSDATVNDGEKVGEPADPEKDGYTFEGWYADPEMTEPFDFDTPITEDTIVYAKFTEEEPPEPETHTVTFVDGEDPDTVYSDATVNDGEKVGKPDDPKKDGYTFEGWYADPEMTEPFDFDTPITEDTIVYAKFTKIVPADDGADQKEESDVPNTGDNSDILLWSGLMVIAIAGVSILALDRRRYNRKRSR